MIKHSANALSLETRVEPSLSYSSNVNGRGAAPTYSPASGGANALEFLTRLAGDLSRGQVELPCFPNIVVKIRDALLNPRTTPEQTVKLIGSEPRLAARLIQTANSAALNPTGKRVTELRTAITRLGQQIIQSAAVAFAVQQMKDAPKLKSISEPLRALWKESIAVAAISQVVARRTKVLPDEAFLTGLLHGIGRLYILVNSVNAPGVLNGADAADLVAGWHPSIGKAVAENWELGETIAEAINDQCDYERGPSKIPDLTDVMVVSLHLSQFIGQPGAPITDIDQIRSFKAMGLTEQDCRQLVTHAEYSIGSLQEVLG